jgi:CDP-glucose 4,6-dehydratase
MAKKEGIVGEAFNFSNEIQVSVLELTEKILQLVAREDIKPTILNEAQNEIPHQYLDSEKARRLLNWKPIYSLDEGLLRTIEWYKIFLQREF